MEKIAVFGTGLMGKEMAIKLAKNNYYVIAYNRTEAKLESLKKLGIKTYTESYLAIASANILILMLTDADAIKEVLL